MYMRKCANIFPYMRRQFIIYDFATASFWISLYMRKIWFSFFSVYGIRNITDFDAQAPMSPQVEFHIVFSSSSLYYRTNDDQNIFFQHFFITILTQREWLKKKNNAEGTLRRLVSNTTLQGKSHLCIPFLGIARPQPQFPHSFVCERFILYSQDRSTYFLKQNRPIYRGNMYINRSQIHELWKLRLWPP